MNQRDKLIAQAEILEWALSERPSDAFVRDKIDELRAEAEAAPVDTPVGWYCPGNGQLYHKDTKPDWKLTEPVYRHPAPVDTRIADLERKVARLRALVVRYSTETPLGHQPHMISLEVEAALKETV